MVVWEDFDFGHTPISKILLCGKVKIVPSIVKYCFQNGYKVSCCHASETDLPSNHTFLSFNTFKEKDWENTA